MALSAGNYLIHSALDEEWVLLVESGSKSKGASIVMGGLTESDNRCYWKNGVVSTNYNRFYNLKTGTGAGYLAVGSAVAGKKTAQNAYKQATGAWLVEDTNETITVHGESVPLYTISAYSSQSLFLTVSDVGDVYLDVESSDSATQQFWFEPTTYVDTKVGTPSDLTTADGVDYIIASGQGSFYPQWKCSKTSIVYEMRTRSRQYDMEGNAGEWTGWTDWTKTIAEKQLDKKKKYTGVMKSTVAVTTPGVDNTNYLQADVEVAVRLTSAKTSGAYNRTGQITHGPSVSAVIRQWQVPAVSLTEAKCTEFGLEVTYESDYTLAGNTIKFDTLRNGVTPLVTDYSIGNQDYEGKLVVDWDLLEDIPFTGDVLTFDGSLTESNGIVSGPISASLTVSFDSGSGMSFEPTYEITDRLTILAKIYAYDSVECFVRQFDLDGVEVWKKVEEVSSSEANKRFFEICPAFGDSPTLMWVVAHTTSGNTQWSSVVVQLSAALILNTNYYVWNWVDDDKVPHCFILKYRAGAIVQPGDSITLPATRFVTTGRDYPVFRYSKSIARVLDVGGTILESENGEFSTREVAETLAKANHCVYRQPDGKWYEVGLKSVSFTRQKMFVNVQITQEAESR